MIDKSLYSRMSSPRGCNVGLKESDRFHIFINANILNGCEFSCAGCYVNKGTNSHSIHDDLKTLNFLTGKINKSSYHLEEIALGPTDFFSARNTCEILSHPDFRKLYSNKDTKLVITSTLKANESEIIKRLGLLEECLPHMDADLLIPIEAESFLENPSIFEEMKKKWNLIKNSSLLFDPSFQINLCFSDIFKNKKNLTKLSEMIRKEFDTILEFNPSVLGTHKNRKNKKKILDYWFELMDKNFDENSFVYTMLNKDHSGMNNFVLNFRRGNFYLCPFVYENVFCYEPEFLIEKSGEHHSLDDLFKARERLYVSQMNYAGQTENCTNCEFLTSCCNKNVLSFMEFNGIRNCFLKKAEMTG